ncbi:hypothetical protein ISCGN_003591 [Ixodes scapularis]
MSALFYASLLLLHAPQDTFDDVGDRLYLTPLIESGDLQAAKLSSRVGDLGPVNDMPSYSGFITVDEYSGSNLFFWFFPAMENPETAPVMLWLQGGPGASSLFGLFVEHGPYLVSRRGRPKRRRVTWARRFSMLYVDSPVGTGFSFTERDQGYARSQEDVARDLFEALQQFFTLFVEYAANDFYIAGESYAGKYVPTLAYAIDAAVQPRVNINLKGIAIGNGFIDPVSMLDYGDYLYQLGLVDRKQAAYIRQETSTAVGLINDGRYLEAFFVVDNLIGGEFTTSTYLENVTGFNFYFNFFYCNGPADHNYYNAFVQTPSVRSAIHVGDQAFHELSNVVSDHLLEDVMMSAKPWFLAIVQKYKVLVYSGQLDIMIAYPLTVNFLSTVEWPETSAFADAPRQIWRTSERGDVAGYVRQAGNFTEVLVRNAGHILPYDQPDAAMDMISRFIDGTSF